MKASWKAVGTNCNALGILHDHVLLIANVPRVLPAAAMPPIIPLEVNSDVKMGRSFGYDSSPMRDEAATIENGIPIPSTILPKTNISTIHGKATQIRLLPQEPINTRGSTHNSARLPG